MTVVIDVQDLQRTFGDNKAVDGMTFTVEPGEVFGLLGPNGAGKTTTVRLLNGILPPSAGTARVFGLDPVTEGEAIRRRTGVLTETPALYERLFARENLEFFATLQAIPQSDLSRRVDEMLEFFELSSRARDTGNRHASPRSNRRSAGSRKDGISHPCCSGRFAGH